MADWHQRIRVPKAFGVDLALSRRKTVAGRRRPETCSLPPSDQIIRLPDAREFRIVGGRVRKTDDGFVINRYMAAVGNSAYILGRPVLGFHGGESCGNVRHRYQYNRVADPLGRVPQPIILLQSSPGFHTGAYNSKPVYAPARITRAQ